MGGGEAEAVSSQLLLPASPLRSSIEWAALSAAVSRLLRAGDADGCSAGKGRDAGGAGQRSTEERGREAWWEEEVEADEGAAAFAGAAAMREADGASGVSACQAVLRLLSRYGVAGAGAGEAEGEVDAEAEHVRCAVLHLVCAQWAAEMERQRRGALAERAALEGKGEPAATEEAEVEGGGDGRGGGGGEVEVASQSAGGAIAGPTRSPLHALRLPCLPLPLFSSLLSSLTAALPSIPLRLHPSLLSSLTWMAEYVQGDSRAVIQLVSLALHALYAEEQQRRASPYTASSPPSPRAISPLLAILSVVDGRWADAGSGSEDEDEDEGGVEAGGVEVVTSAVWHSALCEARRLMEESMEDGSRSLFLSPLCAASLSLFEWGLSHLLPPSLPTFHLVVPAFGRPQDGQGEPSSILSFIHFASRRGRQEEEEEEEEGSGASASASASASALASASASESVSDDAVAVSLLRGFLERWRPRPCDGEAAAVLALNRSVELLIAASSTSPPLVSSPPPSLLFPLLCRCLSMHGEDDVSTLPALRAALRLAWLAGAAEERQRQRQMRQESEAAEAAAESSAAEVVKDEDFILLVDLVLRAASAPRSPWPVVTAPSSASDIASQKHRRELHSVAEGKVEVIGDAGGRPPPPSLHSAAGGREAAESDDDASATTALSLLLGLVRWWPSMASSPRHQPHLSLAVSSLLSACVAQGFPSHVSSLLHLVHSLQLLLPPSLIPLAIRALIEVELKADALRLFTRSLDPICPPPLALVEAVLPCLRSEAELRQWLKALHAATADAPPSLSTFRTLLHLLHSLTVAEQSSDADIAALTLDAFDRLHHLAAHPPPPSQPHLARHQQRQQPPVQPKGWRALAEEKVASSCAPLPASLFADFFAFACSLSSLPTTSSLLRLRAAYGYPLSDQAYQAALLPFTPAHTAADNSTSARRADTQPLVSPSPLPHLRMLTSLLAHSPCPVLLTCLCRCVVLVPRA